MGRSSSASSSSNHTVTNTTNYALQGDNQGVAVMGNNNSLVMTDHGAVDAAFALGKDSLFFMDAALTSALAFGEGVVHESMDSVTELSSKQAAENEKQIEAIKQLAENVQTGGQAVIAETSKNMLKAVMIAITVIVGLLALGHVFGGKK